MSFEKNINQFKHIFVLVGLGAGLLIPFNVVKAEIKAAGILQWKFIVALIIGIAIIVFFKFYMDKKEKKVKKYVHPPMPPRYTNPAMPPPYPQPPIQEQPIDYPPEYSQPYQPYNPVNRTTSPKPTEKSIQEQFEELDAP